ncbi:MAG: hypothetical protein M1818_006685 [Claussenomyces sp. TS43310]|nr:MAG: hypothetical protein M1818_006883 [Claussenomyces sp. TS43310]KAI9735107.1 MAG: hypothetical protein M1818_006685 [Claussenomyces sp. TS43310]
MHPQIQSPQLLNDMPKSSPSCKTSEPSGVSMTADCSDARMDTITITSLQDRTTVSAATTPEEISKLQHPATTSAERGIASDSTIEPSKGCYRPHSAEVSLLDSTTSHPLNSTKSLVTNEDHIPDGIVYVTARESSAVSATSVYSWDSTPARAVKAPECCARPSWSRAESVTSHSPATSPHPTAPSLTESPHRENRPPVPNLRSDSLFLPPIRENKVEKHWLHYTAVIPVSNGAVFTSEPHRAALPRPTAEIRPFSGSASYEESKGPPCTPFSGNGVQVPSPTSATVGRRQSTSVTPLGVLSSDNLWQKTNNTQAPRGKHWLGAHEE